MTIATFGTGMYGAGRVQAKPELQSICRDVSSSQLPLS